MATETMVTAIIKWREGGREGGREREREREREIAMMVDATINHYRGRAREGGRERGCNNKS